MKQPLMITPMDIPPAQAEALYDASLKDSGIGRLPSPDAGVWPGEDWDDDSLSAMRHPARLRAPTQPSARRMGTAAK